MQAAVKHMSHAHSQPPWFISSRQSLCCRHTHTHTHARRVMAHCQSRSAKRHSSRLAELLLLRRPELIEPQAEPSSAAHISVTRHAKLS